MPTPEEIEEERERILADVDEARSRITSAQPSTAGMRDEPEEPDATAEEMSEATGRALEGLERGSLVPPPPPVAARDMPPSAPSPFAPPPAAPELRGVTSSTTAPPQRARALGSPSPFSPTPPGAAPAPDVDDEVEDRALASLEGPGALGSPSPTPSTPPARPEPPPPEEAPAAPQPLAPTPPPEPDDEVEDRAVASIAEGTPAEPPATPAEPPTGPGSPAPPQPLAEAPPAAPEAPAGPESAEEQAESGALATLAGEPVDRASALGSPTDDGFRARQKDFLAQQEARVRDIERMAAEAQGERIPTEGDIAGARLRRGLLSPFQALARALMVRGGMTPPAHEPGEVERLEAQRTRMLGEKRTARQEEAQQAAAAAQRAREGRELDLRERQLTQQGELAQQNAARQAAAEERQAASARGQQALTEEQLRGRVSERELADRRRLQGSEETRDERLNARAYLEGISARNPRMAAQVAPLLARVDSMTAEQIRTAMDGEWGRLASRAGIRIGTGAGGGGGAPPAGIQAASQARIARLVAANVLTQEQGDSLLGEASHANPNRRREASAQLDDLERINQQALQNVRADTRLTQATQAQELIPGSGIRAGGHVPEARVTRWGEGFSSAMSNMSGLRRVARIADRYRGASAFGPAASAELIPELTMLRSMVANLGETGVITANEVPTINNALPNPQELAQSDMTLATFGNRLRQWRAILEDNVRSGLVGLGVDAAGQDRVIRTLRQGGLAAAMPEGGGGGARAEGGAPAAAAQPAQGGGSRRYTVRAPNGGTRTVSAEQARQFRQRPDDDAPAREGWTITEVR